jgi:hypothetical protein
MQDISKQIGNLIELVSEIQSKLSYQQKEGFIKTINELETINERLEREKQYA